MGPPNLWTDRLPSKYARQRMFVIRSVADLLRTNRPTPTLAAERMVKAGNMNDDEVDAFLRGNAIKAFGLHLVGVA